ncbi:MAG: DUF835 domain-containing protein [Methanothrix sp.]|uniref:DUF835 domain-containing protein n=1 Tax=Methanothrix sp. TaxID=90426 RepID=UPI00247DB820|nr:DUF835 domain-containing protein [Methanothrix sp.]
MLTILNIFRRKPRVVPLTEPVGTRMPTELSRGSAYLIREKKPEFSFQIFSSLVRGQCASCEHPDAFNCESIGCEECTLKCPCKSCNQKRAQGLCFTTLHPEQIRNRYVLQITPIFWISRRSGGQMAVNSLEVMADITARFLDKSKNPVVLLDGLELLVVMNGFVQVIRFLRDIMEMVFISRGILIVPVNPSALSEREMALIERDMQEIPAEWR